MDDLVLTIGNLWKNFTKESCHTISKNTQDDLIKFLSTKLSVADMDAFKKCYDSSIAKHVELVCDAMISPSQSEVVLAQQPQPIVKPVVVAAAQPQQKTVQTTRTVQPKKKPPTATKIYTDDELDAMTVPNLKEILASMKLSKTGTKVVLITRIKEYQEAHMREDDASISGDIAEEDDNDEDDDSDDDSDDDDDDDDEDDDDSDDEE